MCRLVCLGSTLTRSQLPPSLGRALGDASCACAEERKRMKRRLAATKEGRRTETRMVIGPEYAPLKCRNSTGATFGKIHTHRQIPTSRAVFTRRVQTGFNRQRHSPGKDSGPRSSDSETETELRQNHCPSNCLDIAGNPHVVAPVADLLIYVSRIGFPEEST